MTNRSYFAEIDGLRAIAVTAVITHHLFPQALPLGFLGVDIFFVISGFVITNTLISKPRTPPTRLLSAFYAGRIKRLLPTLLLVTVLTSMVAMSLTANPGSTLKTGLLGLLASSNIYLFLQSVDYFGQAAELNYFTHTWSLAVEEQFYILFPFLLLALGALRGEAGRKLAVECLLAIGSLSLVSFVWFYDKNSALSYLTPLRIWEFSAGCVIALGRPIGQQLHAGSSIYRRQSVVLGVLGCFGSLLLPENFTILGYLMAVGGAALVVHSVAVDGETIKVLKVPFVVYLGRVSYSLYLWHWPVIVAIKWSVGLNFWTAVAALCIVLTLSIISYEYIEQPFRYGGYLRSNRMVACAAITSVFSVSVAVISVYQSARSDVSIAGSPLVGERSVARIVACKDDAISCLPLHQEELDVVLLGDSHVANLYFSIPVQSAERKHVYSGLMVLRSFYQENTAAHLDAVKELEIISEHVGEEDVLIFSMSRSRFYAPKSYQFLGEARASQLDIKKKERFSKAFIPFIQALDKKGVQVYLVDDIPTLCSAIEMRKRRVFSNCFASEAVSLLDRAPLTNLLKKAATIGEKIHYVDPHPVLCSSGNCALIRDSVPLYTDSSPHISWGARYILKRFFEENVEVK